MVRSSEDSWRQSNSADGAALPQMVNSGFAFAAAVMASAAVVEALMAAGLVALKSPMNCYDEDQFSQIVQVKTSLFRQSIENLKEAYR